MLTHRGFSAWIVVNGEPIPEYLAAVDPVANRVSCWIPSEEGQNFAVYWQDHGGKVDTCSFINLDGFVVPGRFLFGNGVSWREGVRTSTNSERPFVFGKVEETTPEAMNQVISPKDIGTITLKIKQIDRVDSRPANPLLNVPSAVLGKRKVGDMCVGYGEQKETYDQYAYTWSVKAHGHKGTEPQKPSTFVTFVFRYRSKEFLQTQGIMPDDPIPVKPAQNRDFVRRIASAPAAQIIEHSGDTPGLQTPTPTPSPGPKPMLLRQVSAKPPKPKPYLRAPSQQPRRPSVDNRRTVSMRAVPTARVDSYPGEGLIRFDEVSDEPFDKSAELDPGFMTNPFGFELHEDYEHEQTDDFL